MKAFKQKSFTPTECIVVLVIAAAVLFVGWSVFTHKQEADTPSTAAITNFEECKAAGNPIAESYPEQCHADGKSFVRDISDDASEGHDKLTSGQGGFTVEIPEGWNIVSAEDSNSIEIAGKDQPTAQQGTAVGIETVTSRCCHGPYVFSISIQDATPLVVRGKSEPFSFDKGQSIPDGKKYTYEYPADFTDDNVTRIKDDRDYMYVSKLKNGKYLVLEYSVYASDPRNQIDTIDVIAQSIRVSE